MAQEQNPIIATLGRRLRLGVIGGGPGAFIGPMHRAAARLDDRYTLVASVLSSDPARGRAAAAMLGIAPERAYARVDAMLAGEAARDDGIDVVAIMTPNDTHYAYCVAALGAGLDVICDKPLCNALDEAIDLVARVRASGRVFCLTHNYTGYPMVRQARAMVQAGMLGAIRLVQVEYVQGGKARPDPAPEGGVAPWRYDPVRGGPSLVMGDIGTHAHNLVTFISGLQVRALAAEVGAIMPGRKVHDFGGALLRFKEGAEGESARGILWVTQAAPGVENCLRIRLSGASGTVEWWQENPNLLHYAPLDGPAQILTRNGPGALPPAVRACRIVSGHPEGFPEGFANLYSDAAEAIAARIGGAEPDPLALDFPSVEDGARGLKFVHAAIESSAADGAWTDCALAL